MDPIRNPYAPGAGSPPPELAGRDAVRQKMTLCIERLRIGRPAKSMMLVGLRGVGKTVLLDQMMRDAEARNCVTIRIEAPEGRSLPAMLAPSCALDCSSSAILPTQKILLFAACAHLPASYLVSR